MLENTRMVGYAQFLGDSMKYRLLMNGNGTYRLERKRRWFSRWEPLSTKMGSPWRWLPRRGIYSGYSIDFKTNEDACKALVIMQERAAHEAREKHWTTVVEVKE